ncbi:PREDICTED: protein ripply3 [Calidris pugnax]|uniref:protein ripply3 n=1 Tax=Calidris pugnax TaxID=198806 RepID=UPI00071C8AB6|nr:PREDICTED: protein ripply3 [Calidris pugnax]
MESIQHTQQLTALRRNYDNLYGLEEFSSLQGRFSPFTWGRVCFSSPALWRPWMLTARDGEMTENQKMSELDVQLLNFRSKGVLGFQHPVRLYLPKSKSQKFLNNIGEKVLASFPVQATIHFYNDDADSEEDEEEISLFRIQPNN